jgi:hypothetical protein
MKKKALLIAAACVGFVATSGVSSAADLRPGARVAAAGYVGPQIFSLRRSYPGFRPGTAIVNVVPCASPWALWDSYPADALYCQRQ